MFAAHSPTGSPVKYRSELLWVATVLSCHSCAVPVAFQLIKMPLSTERGTQMPWAKKKINQLSCLDIKFELTGFLANERKVPATRERQIN